MRRASHILGLLILACMAINCGDLKPHPFSVNVKNVILIVVDTLRANHLGFMGYERETSPFLDEFAAKSVVFENAYVTKSLTLPSFTCLFTGLHTINNKIYKNMWPLSEDLHHLTEDFQDAGFKSYFFSASGILHSRYRMNKGFDVYIDADPHPEEAWHIIEKVTDEINKLDENSPPIFMAIHFWEPHSPYDPDPEVLSLFADPEYEGPMDGSVEVLNNYILRKIELNDADVQHAIDRYDGEIRWLDDQLREFFGFLDEKGLIDNSIIILTSDHGERLGEDHIFQHRRDTELELHIPLVYHFPSDLGAGTRIPALVENTDTLPTVMDILGIRLPKDIDGLSLEHLIGNPDAEHRDLLVSVGINDSGRFVYSHFTGKYRERVKLDIPEPEPVFLEEQDRERLRALGYLN